MAPTQLHTATKCISQSSYLPELANNCRSIWYWGPSTALHKVGGTRISAVGSVDKLLLVESGAANKARPCCGPNQPLVCPAFGGQAGLQLASKAKQSKAKQSKARRRTNFRC